MITMELRDRLSIAGLMMTLSILAACGDVGQGIEPISTTASIDPTATSTPNPSATPIATQTPTITLTPTPTIYTLEQALEIIKSEAALWDFNDAEQLGAWEEQLLETDLEIVGREKGNPSGHGVAVNGGGSHLVFYVGGEGSWASLSSAFWPTPGEGRALAFFDKNNQLVVLPVMPTEQRGVQFEDAQAQVALECDPDERDINLLEAALAEAGEFISLGWYRATRVYKEADSFHPNCLVIAYGVWQLKGYDNLGQFVPWYETKIAYFNEYGKLHVIEVMPDVSLWFE